MRTCIATKLYQVVAGVLQETAQTCTMLPFRRHGNTGDVTIRKKLQSIMKAIVSCQTNNAKGEASKISAYARPIHIFLLWLSVHHPDAWQNVKLVDQDGKVQSSMH